MMVDSWEGMLLATGHHLMVENEEIPLFYEACFFWMALKMEKKIREAHFIRSSDMPMAFSSLRCNCSYLHRNLCQYIFH